MGGYPAAKAAFEAAERADGDFGWDRDWSCLALGDSVGPAVFVTGLRTATGAGPSREETLTLQQRLTDAGCYQDAIDGAKGAALDEAVKACPDQRPVLRIETGMYTATISRVGVDGACTKLATASDDKTVRVWSLPDGRLEQTIRLTIGAGNGGKVYAAALSPDGRWLAAGGWDTSYEKTNTFSLKLVDLRTGAVRRLGAFDNEKPQVARVLHEELRSAGRIDDH